MRVLVTGGAGFIGSNIARVLEERGAKISILDDFSCASYKNLLGIKGEVICADILDEGIFRKLPKFDAIIHEAAVTDTTLKDDRKMVMVNFNGFKKVLEFCQHRKIKLVYASSAGVYGNGSFMKEDQPSAPHNTYAYSKYLCDCLFAKVKRQSRSLIVGLRYFNVYGPYEDHKGISASMAYQLYLQMKQNKRPRVFKYGQQKRDFIYVKDVARITVEALSFKKNIVLNVGTGAARSFNDIIAALNKSLAKNLEPDYFDNPFTGAYQDFTQADTTLLNRLKLAAKFSLEEGIEDYVKNHLKTERY